MRPRLLKNSDLYLEWLAEVVECINSAHNPRVPSAACSIHDVIDKNCNIFFLQVKKKKLDEKVIDIGFNSQY